MWGGGERLVSRRRARNWGWGGAARGPAHVYLQQRVQLKREHSHQHQSPKAKNIGEVPLGRCGVCLSKFLALLFFPDDTLCGRLHQAADRPSPASTELGSTYLSKCPVCSPSRQVLILVQSRITTITVTEVCRVPTKVLSNKTTAGAAEEVSNDNNTLDTQCMCFRRALLHNFAKKLKRLETPN